MENMYANSKIIQAEDMTHLQLILNNTGDAYQQKLHMTTIQIIADVCYPNT